MYGETVLIIGCVGPGFEFGHEALVSTVSHAFSLCVFAEFFEMFNVEFHFGEVVSEGGVM